MYGWVSCLTGGIVETDIRETVETAVGDAGLLLVELKQTQVGRRLLLRVFVDRQGRVSIDECIKLSRSIEESLEQDLAIEGSYVIEVSSPGIGRLLQSDTDWKRVTGRELRVDLEEETFESQLESYDGTLLSFTDGRIVPVALVSRAVEVLK
jgi:ribosome maturation factor RimP